MLNSESRPWMPSAAVPQCPAHRQKQWSKTGRSCSACSATGTREWNRRPTISDEVDDIGNAVTVAVGLIGVEVIRRVVTDVADAVAIGVSLIGVNQLRTIIMTVGDHIPVRVGLGHAAATFAGSDLGQIAGA